MKKNSFIVVITCLLLGSAAAAAEWSGSAAVEYRLFTEDALLPNQNDSNASIYFEPEFFHDWDEGKQNIVFKPFVRLDENDEQRSHADIRELSWLKVMDASELRVGIRKVYWGVTEAQHLVDVINQSDLVENPDGEDKLGQPMINLALINDWGTVDLFILPLFRERTFPGIDGRLRTLPHVDTDNPVYQSKDKEQHIDYAARWSRSIQKWDIGLSYFYGTNREPGFVPGTDSQNNPVLRPVYNLMHQAGLDLQATYDKWLWKLEAINRRVKGADYNAATVGFEYSFYGVMETASDIGLVMEYLYDDRGVSATTPFEDDLMLGLRWALNDEASTEALLGVIEDMDGKARLFTLEASRRLDENWKINIEARMFSGVAVNDPLYSVRNDDYLYAELAYYF